MKTTFTRSGALDVDAGMNSQSAVLLLWLQSYMIVYF